MTVLLNIKEKTVVAANGVRLGDIIKLLSGFDEDWESWTIQIELPQTFMPESPFHWKLNTTTDLDYKIITIKTTGNE